MGWFVRHAWLTLLAGSAALIVPGCISADPPQTVTAAEASSGPRLQWSSSCNRTDLGEGQAGQVLDGVLGLKNIGTDRLAFWVSPGCACAYVKPQSGQVEPGQVAEVHVGVRLRQEGTDERVVVRVTTNDPENSIVEQMFLAKCPAPFVVTPRTVDFGTFPQGATKKITLKIADRNGKRLDAGESASCLSSLPYVSANVNRDKQQIDFFLGSDAPRGCFAGYVIVRLATAGKELSVPVTGRAVGEVTVAPDTVFLRYDSAKAAFRDVIAVVRRSDQKPPGRWTVVSKPAWLAIEALDPPDAKLQRLRFRASENPVQNGGKAAQEHTAVLHFENVTQQVTIKLDILPTYRQERSSQ